MNRFSVLMVNSFMEDHYMNLTKNTSLINMTITSNHSLWSWCISFGLMDYKPFLVPQGDTNLHLLWTHASMKVLQRTLNEMEMYFS